MEATTRGPRIANTEATDLIAAAIAAAIASTGWVKKDGSAPWGKFASSEAVLGEVRAAMAANGLAVFCRPAIERVGEQTSSKGNALQIWQVNNHIDLLHVSGQRLSTVYPAIVMDADPGKAVLKGITVSLRYFLQNLLIVPRGDDPEADERPPRQADERTAEQRQTEPTRQAAPWQPDEIRARLRAIHAGNDEAGRKAWASIWATKPDTAEAMKRFHEVTREAAAGLFMAEPHKWAAIVEEAAKRADQRTQGLVSPGIVTVGADALAIIDQLEEEANR